MSITNHPNVRAAIAMSKEELDELPIGEVIDTDKTIRDKIIHVLSIYPQISTSMLQIGVGTSLMPALWKPVLEKMIEEGIVKRVRKTVVTPTDRQQSYTILSLAQPDAHR